MNAFSSLHAPFQSAHSSVRCAYVNIRVATYVWLHTCGYIRGTDGRLDVVTRLRALRDFTDPQFGSCLQEALYPRFGLDPRTYI